MPDEGFVLAARYDDALLERWATRVVVTTERVLAVRHVLFEWNVAGARHDWIRGIEQVDGGSTLRVEQDVDADEFAFPDAETARAVVAAVEARIAYYQDDPETNEDEALVTDSSTAVALAAMARSHSDATAPSAGSTPPSTG